MLSCTDLRGALAMGHLEVTETVALDEIDQHEHSKL